jgi:chromosome partitioning protein
MARKIIAVANQKGGVGKTTTAVNFAACLAHSGYATLLIDFDPQGNAGSGLGVCREEVEHSVYEVLLGTRTLAEVAIKTSTPNLTLIPATKHLAAAEVELVDHPRREFRLREILASATGEFDYVIIDCPPSMGLLTINALTASDTVLVPIQTEYYALEGLGQLVETIGLIHEHLNPALTIEGILLTMFDSRTNLSRQVAGEVVDHFGNLVFDTVIPRNVRLGESPSFGKPIIEYAAQSTGARSYEALASEFLSRNLAA